MPKSKKSTPNKPKNKKSAKADTQHKKLSSVVSLFKTCLLTMQKQWRTFSIVLFAYIALDLIFVKGFSSSYNVPQLKALYDSAFNKNALSANTSVFGTLLGNSATGNQSNSGVYVILLFLIFSLVIIWLLRQTLTKGAAKRIGARPAFYGSMAPLVPFVIVGLLILVELIPLAIGAYIYSAVFANNLAIGAFSVIVWAVICIAFVVLSLWLVISTVFAAYIVTLPGMKPTKAIKSSWSLVKKRKILVFRKIFFFFVLLLVLIAIVGLPFIAVLPGISEWIIFGLGIIGVGVVHSYIYTLYRELL